MNGEDIPIMHGYPLRLVTGGWPASTCGKWLNRIVIRNKEHDGPKMTGMSYRVQLALAAAVVLANGLTYGFVWWHARRAVERPAA